MAEALVCFAVLFIVGGVLLLERRCLGQLAFAQPLVVCSVAGHISGQIETGIWLGISLQLLSVGQGHWADWALAGIIAAAGLYCCNFYNLNVPAGSFSSVILISVSVASAIFGRIIEQRHARIDGGILRRNSLWEKRDISLAIKSMIYKRLVRGFLIGGVQSVTGVLLSGYLISDLSGMVVSTPIMLNIAAITIPSLGVAIAVGSLFGYRFIGYASVGFVVTFAVKYWVF